MPFIVSMIARHPSLAETRDVVEQSHALLLDCIRSGGKILTCGNGGSAADAEHIVGELMKGFTLTRPLSADQVADLARLFPDEAEEMARNLQQAIPAVSLVAGVALPTAFNNDVNPDYVFAQQVFGLGRPGDVLIAISTSGNSRNVVHAAKVARARGLRVLALTGAGGGRLAGLADLCIRVPATDVAAIQELHLPVYHTLCAMLETALFGEVGQASGMPAPAVAAPKTRALPDPIGLLVFDFDGVFTDNKVITFEDGREAVLCDRRDSLGLNQLKRLGLPMMILSTETNSVVGARGRKLGIPVEGGCADKAAYLAQLLKDKGIAPDSVVYMGNDLNDLEAMTLVGYAVAPADSHPQIKRIADLVLRTAGGHGAVREFCDYVLQQTSGS